MNSFLSIIYSAIILTLFITIIELTKNKFKRKYLKTFKDEEYLDDEEHYKTIEFKSIFFSTISYAIVLTLTLHLLRDYIHYDINKYLFKDLTSSRSLINIVQGSLYIIFLNSILYSGYIIQLVNRIDILNFEKKNSVLIMKENFYGPILEEYIYRGIIFNIFKEARFSNLESSMISSLMFGVCNHYFYVIFLAHLRHFWDLHYNKMLFASIIFQAIFTTVFGMYACFSYVKTETLIAPVILHVLCNTLQFPRFHYLNSGSLSRNFKNCKFFINN